MMDEGERETRDYFADLKVRIYEEYLASKFEAWKEKQEVKEDGTT